jgi:hypothetical protein
MVRRILKIQNISFLLIFIIFSNCSSNENEIVPPDTEYETWKFDSNSSLLGDLNLNYDDDVLSGFIQLDDGTRIDLGSTNFSESSNAKKLSFTRTTGEAQQYFGWFQAQDDFISGYFKFNDKERPWVAFPEEIPEFNSNSNPITESYIDGRWELNSNNSLIGNITLSNNGGNWSGSFSGNDGSSFELNDLEINVQNESATLSFTRSSGEAQQYFGWFQAHGNYLSGYFKFSNKERPFYGKKID